MAQPKQVDPEHAGPVSEEPDEIVVEEAPTAEAPRATATLTDERSESPSAGERVVYVTTPIPPKARSNRVVGTLLALAGAAVFALVYGAVGAGLIALGVVGRDAQFSEFITDAIFWIPVLAFAIGFVATVLLLNRSAWWVHVLASVLVAAIVYFGSVGLLLLATRIAGQAVAVRDVALAPLVLVATLVAREVSIWMGMAIAWRGGRVTARNKSDRAAWDAEQSTKTAPGAGSATAP